MIVALEHTWTHRPRRPGPRTLDEVADIARREDQWLRARVRLAEGWGEVCFAGRRVVHAKLGWAVGTRALRRIAAQAWREVGLEPHGAPTLLTIDRPWSSVRRELPALRPYAPTPRPSGWVRGVDPRTRAMAASPGRPADRCRLR